MFSFDIVYSSIVLLFFIDTYSWYKSKLYLCKSYVLHLCWGCAVLFVSCVVLSRSLLSSLCCILFCLLSVHIYVCRCMISYVCILCVCICAYVCVVFGWGSVQPQSDTPHVGCLCGYMVRIIKAKKTQPLIKLK